MRARHLIEVAFRGPSTTQWKIQAWAGGDSWGDVKVTANDGQTYEVELFPSREAAEKEMRDFPSEGPGEYRVVPANTRSDVDYYEGANAQNEDRPR